MCRLEWNSVVELTMPTSDADVSFMLAFKLLGDILNIHCDTVRGDNPPGD